MYSWLSSFMDLSVTFVGPETVSSESSGWIGNLINLSVAAILVITNGFFVAAEFSLVKIRVSRIDDLIEGGRPFASTAKWLACRLEQSLSACQLGITMASLALGWVGEPAFKELLQPIFRWIGISSEGTQSLLAFIVAFTFITALHLVIGEQAPKIFAIRQPERMLLWCAVPMKLFYICSYPLMAALNATTSWLLHRMGLTGESSHGETLTETELRAMVHQAHAHGELTRNEQRLIDAIFEFDDLVCRRIMLPRNDVDFVDISTPPAETMAMIRRTQHTRYPVCDGSLDNVRGVLHIKDLLQTDVNDVFDFHSVARPPRKVPENMPVGKLLRHFQGTHQLMAFVIDEHGTIIGIVTLENVMEEIVGDVADEFDIEDPEIVPDGPGQYVAVGSTPIGELERRLDVSFEAPEVDTLSGLLMHYTHEVIEEGRTIDMGRVEAHVLEASSGRATRVRLTVRQDT